MLPTPLDLAPITRSLRAMAGSRLLLVAVHHIPVFEVLRAGPLPVADLAQRLGLQERPAMVFFPALCSLNLLYYTPDGTLALTPLGHYLSTGKQPNLISYTGLEKNDPAVLNLAELLRNDGPRDNTQGVTYVKDNEAPSPMDDPETARYLTLALAGRAEYLAPVVAARLPRSSGHLLDVAAGSGYFTFAWLLANPDATATVFDRPAVLQVAQELLTDFCRSGRAGVGSLPDRITFAPGDMLTDNLPDADIILAASLLHDWPTATCVELTHRFAHALQPGGTLWVHDAFLHDSLDGPQAATDYAIMLFTNTKGRIYSRQEHRNWFINAGLIPSPENYPTLLDYHLISARKPQ